MEAIFDFREVVILAMIFIPLERLLPQRPDQRVFRRHWLNDTVYLLVNGVVIKIGVLLVFAAAMALLPARLPSGGYGPIGSLPLWAQVPLAILVADIGYYAQHRLVHRVPLLWRFHAVHHSITELDWLAAHRIHACDQILLWTFSWLPLFLLGFSGEALVIFALLFIFQSRLIHANVAINLGPFNRLVATPHFHHWHHSNEPGTHDSNFSGQLLLMDWLFGTLRLPDRYPEVYGTDDPVPDHYPLQLAWPFLRQGGDSRAPSNTSELEVN